MPASPRWLLRIPEILDFIDRWPEPWLDRPALESVFQVKRRRAIDLLHAFGGFQVGRTFLVDRASVASQLLGIQRGDSFHWEQRRRRKMSESLSEARRSHQARQVRIEVAPAPPSWPEGVHLDAGHLTIDFRDVPDLLAKLYGLARSAASDFEAFEAAVRAVIPAQS